MRTAGLLVGVWLAWTVGAAELVEKPSEAPPLNWNTRAAGFIHSCVRDPFTGHLWVGTEAAGAWCFDGAKWARHTTKTGLVDDNVHAIAVDHQRRVWVGHAHRGVSVFDGKTWRNYDALVGPLGSRIFTIKVCPTGPRSGEVWIASDAGVTRYWPKDDSWTHVTRPTAFRPTKSSVSRSITKGESSRAPSATASRSPLRPTIMPSGGSSAVPPAPAPTQPATACRPA